jgi:archaellum component FlaG (FlaF/FlaG flagellin family)
MTVSQRSPLARLVLFMVCLAIAGSILAGAHYYAVDLPQQKTLQAPENAESSNSNCEICRHNCLVDPDYYSCLSICNDLECS